MNRSWKNKGKQLLSLVLAVLIGFGMMLNPVTATELQLTEGYTEENEAKKEADVTQKEPISSEEENKESIQKEENMQKTSQPFEAAPLLEADDGEGIVLEALEEADCEVTVVNNGHGSIKKGNEAVENSFFAEENESIVLNICPDEGYRIKAVRLDGTDIGVEAAAFLEDGSYQYALTVVQACTIEVEFEEIPTVQADFEASGLSLSVLPSSEGKVYTAEPVTLSETNGKYIRLLETEAYTDSIEISQSMTITSVFLRDASPAGFGTESKITLSQQIEIVIDTESPTLTLEKEKMWVDENTTEITVAGSAADNVSLSRVVYAKTKLQKAEILAETTHIISNFENGKFVVQNLDLNGTVNQFYFYAVDAVGNCSSESVVFVYQDAQKPQITEFRMEANGVFGSDTSFAPAVIKTAYGFYFKEAATVLVYATDGEGENASGVAKILYYTMSIDSLEQNVIEADADEEGKIRFVIPAGFKGQIFACAKDGVGNQCDYVSPSGVIVEDKIEHEKETHIEIENVEENQLYAQDVEIDLTVTDTYSGILKIEWSVEAPYDTEKNQSGTAEIDSLGAIDSGDDEAGWSIEETDENLVTKVKKSILVSNNSNDIVLKVKMSDRAGNESEKILTFGIDKEKPVISLEFETDIENAAYPQNYRDLTAVITVVERNFDPDAITVNLTNTYGKIDALSQWQTTENIENPDETSHTARIVFSEEGQYTLSISGEDLAGNQAEQTETKEFTLDTTSPEIQVLLDTTDAYEEVGTEEAEETRYWYASAPKLSYEASDRKEGKAGSGLYQRKIYLNEESLSEYEVTYAAADYQNAAQEENGEITAGSLSGMKAGKNVVEVWFLDMAGNEGSGKNELYLDLYAPTIIGFQVEKEKNSTIGTILNTLTFGAFFNENVILTVSVDDSLNLAGERVASSGLKEVTLYLDGEPYQTTAVEAGASEVEFKLPQSAVLTGNESIYLDKDVSAMVTDNVGRTSAITDVTSGNSNLEHVHLMVETIKPKIEAVISKEDYRKDNVIFNNSDTGFTVTAKDMESGLRTVTIQINDTVLVDEHYYQEEEKITEETYEVNTKDVPLPQDSWYQMKVTVVDNAGNGTVLFYPENGMYKDMQAPEIVRFEMKAEGEIEADGKKLSYEETDYGYYFLEDTTVSIYATDGTEKKDSGVKEIRYYTVGADGVTSPVVTAKTDQEDKIRFKVEANFKGQIYACAWDNVRNSTEKYVTPSGVIIETSKEHKKEEHILIQKEKAPYKDQKGHALYDKTVPVTVTVTDTYSGIRMVEWTVESPQDTASNQSGKVELDNQGGYMSDSKPAGWKKEAKDRNLITEMKKTFQVSNNSNNITVKIKMTDRAGNTSSDKISFGIDKTNPTISITFDNESPDPEFRDIYKEDRTATITVKERNFDSNAIKVTVTNTDSSIPQLSNWETVENAANPDETENRATVLFSEDGDYTLEVEGMDLAENPAQSEKADDFTLDKTLPVIAVTYDNNNAINGNYYASERTAQIEITEHNFVPERVQILGTSTDNGREIAFPMPAGWNTAGDVHTASIVCGTDGLYRFDIEYTDQAGNQAERYTGEEYYVDMTEPEIEISGVENYSANNGDVIPVISFTDTNYDGNGVEIMLSGANRGEVEAEGTYSSQANGQVYTMNNFPEKQEYDDLYTLTATLRDRAGNESTDSIVFSVNRFGSIYMLDESLKNISGTYIQNEIDVRLSEVNVDSLENTKSRIVVDTNGTPRDLVKGSDYTVKETGGDGTWHQYDYMIDKSLFEGDGRYIVTLYSQDAAGNINENIDETKRAEISFGVDKTSPVVVPIDLESNTQYAVDTKQATVTVNDNLVLNEVEIYIDDTKCEYEADGEGYRFSIPSKAKPQEVRILAVDAANNRTNYILSGILVTTNLFIRWYNNKPLFAGTLAGIALLGGAIMGMLLYFGKRKRRKKEAN